MLFRDFKTGPAIGLTALLFSSGAGAGTLGSMPADSPATPETDDRGNVNPIRTKNIATEIFDGTARTNGMKGFMLAAGDVWFEFDRALRSDAVNIDVNLEGAEFADAMVSASFYQSGLVLEHTAEVAYMDDGEVYDTASSVAILRGRDTVVASVRPAGRIGIDPYSDPAFSRIIKAGDASQTSAMLGTATVTINQNMDEDNSVVTAAQLINGGEIMVEHGVLGDDVFTRVCIGEPTPSNRTCAPSRSHTIEDGVATFSLMNNVLVPSGPTSAAVPGSNPHALYVAFDGRTAISSWAAGSASVMFTDRGRGLLVPEGGEGPLALISRGGLNTELNMAQSSAGDGGIRVVRERRSWLRERSSALHSRPLPTHRRLVAPHSEHRFRLPLSALAMPQRSWRPPTPESPAIAGHSDVPFLLAQRLFQHRHRS